MSVSRKNAIRRTRAMQVVGLVCIALTAGAVMYDPDLPVPSAPVIVDDGLLQQEDSQPSGNFRFTSLDINAERVGERIDSIGGIKDAPVGADEDVQQIEPITPAVADNGWKYLGGVFEPNFSFALVEIDGSQRMLKAGSRLADLNAEVVSVTPEAIEIDRNGAIERISLQSPTGDRVSVNTNAPSESDVLNMSREEERRNRRDQQMHLDNQMMDAEKRRADFERRMQERSGQMRGENQ